MLASVVGAACSSDDDAAGGTAPAATEAPSTTEATTEATTAPPSTTDAVTTTEAPSTTGLEPATTLPAEPAGTGLLPAPDGDAFYTPPDPLPGDGPGDLIWARAYDGAPAGGVGWQVLYRSENVAGEPIAVSGLVIAPATPTGSDIVLDWAHGTTGMGDQCAPSKGAAGFSAEGLVGGIAVDRGWTFVATDYEGLGTPGVHPYLVGESEGRGVLDIVRAAAQLAGAGVDADARVAIFGHSQGGHAALMAAELAPTYAPELDVVGTVAGAPPGELPLIAAAFASATTRGAAGGFGLMMQAGFLAAYPDLPVDAAVDAAAQPLLDEVADTCTEEAFDLAAGLTTAQPDPSANADWRAALEANSPGAVDPDVPVLIYHGDADTTVPPTLSKTIRDQYCALGVTVQRTVYADADHITVVFSAIGEIQGWIQDRLDGLPAPDNCAESQST